MADPKLLEKMTKEEAKYIEDLGPKVIFDMHNSTNEGDWTQEVVPLDEEDKAQRLLDYRHSKANKAEQAEKAAAKQAALDKLKALGLSDDNLKALGL